MLLGYDDIVALIDSGAILNADKERVNAASLDLHLGSRFLVAKQLDEHSLPELVSLRMPPTMVEHTGQVLLPPGGFCLAETREVFHLPDDIAAEVKLRSSAARMGLNHALAGWCDPGWHGSVLTLEFYNALPYGEILLSSDERVVQMVFFRLAKPVPKHASYRNRGRYNNDKTVTGTKV